MSRHKKRKPLARRFTKEELAIRRSNRLVKLDERMFKAVFREKPVSVPKTTGVVVKVTPRTTPRRAKQKRKTERMAIPHRIRKLAKFHGRLWVRRNVDFDYKTLFPFVATTPNPTEAA